MKRARRAAVAIVRPLRSEVDAEDAVRSNVRLKCQPKKTSRGAVRIFMHLICKCLKAGRHNSAGLMPNRHFFFQFQLFPEWVKPRRGSPIPQEIVLSNLCGFVCPSLCLLQPERSMSLCHIFTMCPKTWKRAWNYGLGRSLISLSQPGDCYKQNSIHLCSGGRRKKKKVRE